MKNEIKFLKRIILDRASKNSRQSSADDAPPPPIKVQEVKAARSLASDITQRGAKLYDLLSTEVSERSVCLFIPCSKTCLTFSFDFQVGEKPGAEIFGFGWFIFRYH